MPLAVDDIVFSPTTNTIHVGVPSLSVSLVAWCSGNEFARLGYEMHSSLDNMTCIISGVACTDRWSPISTIIRRPGSHASGQLWIYVNLNWPGPRTMHWVQLHANTEHCQYALPMEMCVAGGYWRQNIKANARITTRTGFIYASVKRRTYEIALYDDDARRDIACSLNVRFTSDNINFVCLLFGTREIRDLCSAWQISLPSTLKLYAHFNYLY